MSEMGVEGLYFVQAVGANLVKIGWVKNVERIDARLARMATDCPYPVRVLHLHRGATRSDESTVHKVFERRHHYGEWFRIEGELRAFLQLCAVEADVARGVLHMAMQNKGLTLPLSFA